MVQSKPSMMASLSLVVSLRPQLSRPTLEAVGCTQFTLSACLYLGVGKAVPRVPKERVPPPEFAARFPNLITLHRGTQKDTC